MNFSRSTSQDQLLKIAPSVRIHHHARYINNGHIVVTGGAAAGIDGALHLRIKLISKEHAEKVAAQMCYGWKGNSTTKFPKKLPKKKNEGTSWKTQPHERLASTH